MSIEALNCPNCGAPLRPKGSETLLWCIYCNSAVHLKQQDDQAQAANVETTLSDDDMSHLRDLLLKGQSEEALDHYQMVTGVPREAAQKALEQLKTQLTLATMRRQQLTGYGIALVFLCILLLITSLAALILGKLAPLVALALAGYAAFELLVFAPALRVTLRFLRGHAAPAEVLKVASVGVMKKRKMEVHNLWLLLEVRPDGEPPFQAEILLPTRRQSLPKVKPGYVLWVKYLPDDPEQVTFLKPGD